MSAATRLSESSGAVGTRAEALLRAIGYAAEVPDPPALGALVVRWELDGSGPSGRVRRTLARVIACTFFEDAVHLARAEVSRVSGSYDEPSARYALGRALEAFGDTEAAMLAYDRAAELGADQPRLRRSAEARAVYVRLVQGPRADAIERGERLLPLTEALPEERLWVALAALGSAKRYRRAGAIDELGALVSGPLERSVLAFSARHAMQAGVSLTAIEADRLGAVFAAAGVEEAPAKERLHGWLDLAAGAAGAATRASRADPEAASLLPRAGAVLDGAPPGPRPATARALTAWLGLKIIHAHGQRRALEVRATLDEAIETLAAGQRIESALWTAAVLVTPSHPARGAKLIGALITSEGDPPPRGYAGVASAAERAGREDLAIELLRLGAERREKGARRRLALHTRARGWAAAERGERHEAIALLREAKRLS